LSSTWGHYSSKKTNHKKILAEDFLDEDWGKKQQQELKIIVVFDSNKNKPSKYKNYDRHHKRGVFLSVLRLD
jgi:hypothetical protein